MLREGYESVQRNARTLLLYIAAVTAIYITRQFVDMAFETRLEDAADTPFGRRYLAASGVLTTLVYAFVQTVAYCRLGADIDRPFWKVRALRDGLKRFYGLWLLLGLANLTAIMFITVVDLGQETQSALLLMWLTASAFIVPLGATFMFYGGTGPDERQAAAATFARHMPSYFLLVMFGMTASAFILVMNDYGTPGWLKPAFAVLDGFVEFYVFACTWYICRVHRDSVDDHDDYDF